MKLVVSSALICDVFSVLTDVRAELVELISQATEDETRATYEPLLEMLEVYSDSIQT